MTRRLLAVVLLVGGLLLSAGSVRGAWACSCAGVPELVSFVGIVEEESPKIPPFGDRDYRFAIDDDPARAETVRVSTDEPGESGVSSCAATERLVRGARYAIAASVGSSEDGSRHLFLGSCGGSATLIAAPDESSDVGRSNSALVLGAIAAATAIGGLVVLRRKLHARAREREV